ncbi:MAG: RHS repeat protein [Betaproteobacteria bacterium]|nr:RHS repeat protein [Betaproteobacteria bacterium]
MTPLIEMRFRCDAIVPSRLLDTVLPLPSFPRRRESSPPKHLILTSDTSGQLIETTQPDGVKLYYDYDTAERLIRLRDDHGNRIDYTLDAMSQKTAETVFDSLGNLRRMSSRSVNPFGTQMGQSDAFNNATAYTYDPTGNRTPKTVNGETQGGVSNR